MLRGQSRVLAGVQSLVLYQVRQQRFHTDNRDLLTQTGYSGAATNILTDLIYTVSPLVYISRVQLPNRTLWGVRAVFLLGLM
jgi:hypothetical protein